jgi:hypothetical protein
VDLRIGKLGKTTSSFQRSELERTFLLQIPEDRYGKKKGKATDTTLPWKWAQLESNQPPTDYESVALTE